MTKSVIKQHPMWVTFSPAMRPYAPRMSSIAAVSIPSALQSATSAIQRAGNAVAQDATVVASAQPISRETIQALLDSRQQVLYTSAAAKLIEASDQMTQSVIDTFA